MKCFYHDDLDGKCSGAIVKHHNKNCEMFVMDYDKEFPFHLIKKNEEIWLVDFSFQKPGEFKHLYDMIGFDKIVWIDHHQTAIKKIEEEGLGDLKGIRKDTFPSASMLTWDFFKREKLPHALNAINKWDTWTHDDDPFVLDFINGMGAYETSPESASLWRDLLFSENNNLFKAISKEGEILGREKKINNKNFIEKYGFEVQFDDQEFKDYKCFACNTKGSSKTFDSVIKDYDIVITFIFNGKEYIISLYTEKDLKVNKIALKYGGGGHPQAAGFERESLPFSRKE